MSLNDKYTPEELDAIPPFTGFHHNKVKEELLEKAAQSIKDRCDDLVFNYPEINKDVAEALNAVVEKFKKEKENETRDVIKNIVDKIHERKLSGKECEVAIMSYSDYDALQSMHDFKIDSVWIAGCLLKIHSSINLKDGEIEIY